MDKQPLLELIVKLCKEKQSFNDLAEKLDGLDPVIISDYLKELEALNELKRYDGGWVRYSFRRLKSTAEIPATPTSVISNSEQYFSFHKKPHPLDFEWRNSQETLYSLCDLIQASGKDADRILLLGMPGLFMASQQKKIRREIFLVDKNHLLLSDLKKLVGHSSAKRIIEDDVFTTSPSLLPNCKGAFIDPPWYSLHFLGFIWLAAQCVELGGYLAISLPQINIRPGLSQEREQWISYCKSLGLILEDLEIGKMEYIMPFFEFNAFRAAGVADLLPFWRKGDLAIFRKTSIQTIMRPEPEENSVWDEIEINNVRIRVNTIDSETGDFHVQHLLPADILPTVSSRDERRKKANIWTSGNRIFRTNNPWLFLKHAQQYNRFSDDVTQEYALTKEYLDYITDIETKEYNNYLDWINYELERRNDSGINKNIIQ